MPTCVHEVQGFLVAGVSFSQMMGYVNGSVPSERVECL